MNNFPDKGLIETDELAAMIERQKAVKLCDATYGAGGRESFAKTRIHNAVFFDIDEIADKTSSMKHMLPSPEEFERQISALGISNDDFVVIYDQSGIAMAAARAWWMFRVFGHDNVCVLNGGLPCWKTEGRSLAENTTEQPEPGTFRAKFRPELVKGMKDVKQALESGQSTVIDARSAERYAGLAPEPREGMRAGHMPGSINLPYAGLINPEDGRLRDTGALKNLLSEQDFKGQVIASCGSGVTACVPALAFYNTGIKDVAVYDGSWCEWGREDSGAEIAAAA